MAKAHIITSMRDTLWSPSADHAVAVELFGADARRRATQALRPQAPIRVVARGPLYNTIDPLAAR
jgi:hypothetical protein